MQYLARLGVVGSPRVLSATGVLHATTHEFPVRLSGEVGTYRVVSDDLSGTIVLTSADP